MELQDIIISEDKCVKDAISRLESVRCKVVYVSSHEGKLVGSVSDGDVRRYALNGNDVECKISAAMNKEPVFAYENGIESAKKEFETSEFYPIPIVNYNHEITGVLFRKGTIIRKRSQLNIPVVIMAGGKGTRLYPYTKILPKALIPIGEIPITELIISNFAKMGCDTFYLIINHMKKMIKAYFESVNSTYQIKYIEEETPLGTGGGLSLLKKESIAEEFILTCCDIVVDINYADLIDYHRQNEYLITIVVANHTNQIPYGVVDVDEESNYIGMREKPTYHNLINTGFYVVNRRIIDDLEENEHIDFTDIIQKYRNLGEKIGCYIIDEAAYMDMGRLEELEKMKEQLGIG